MPIHEGDLVEIDYTIKADDTIIESTLVAVGASKKRLEPLFTAIGQSGLPGEVEKAIKAAEPGQILTVTLSPKMAWGERLPSLIETVPIAKLRKAGVKPEAGVSVSKGGMEGTIVSVHGGRCKIDFNHQHAGKTAEYEVVVRKAWHTAEEKIDALVGRLSDPTGNAAWTMEHDVDGRRTINLILPRLYTMMPKADEELASLIARLRHVTGSEADVVVTVTYPRPKAALADPTPTQEVVS